MMSLKSFWRTYSRNKLAVCGLCFLIFLVAVAISAAYLSPNPPLQTAVGPSLSPPSKEFPMGTDTLGRDIFSGMVHGAKITLQLSILAALTAGSIGTAVGLFSGYLGGWIDDVLMRITEIVMVIPLTVFAIVLATLFGPTIWNIIFIVGFLTWPPIARIVRAEVLSLKNTLFVEAARSLGATTINILLTEILPNTYHVVIASVTLQVGATILVEANLSFLGLSDPNLLSWGRMLSIAQGAIFAGGWWAIIFPGFAIAATVLAFNAFGEGLSDVLNPRRRRLQ